MSADLVAQVVASLGDLSSAELDELALQLRLSRAAEWAKNPQRRRLRRRTPSFPNLSENRRRAPRNQKS